MTSPEAATLAHNCHGPVESSQHELAFICHEADGSGSLFTLVVSVHCQAINTEEKLDPEEKRGHGGQPEPAEELSCHCEAGKADAENTAPEMPTVQEDEILATEGLRLRRCTSRDFERRVAYTSYTQEPESLTSSSRHSARDWESGEALRHSSASPATTLTRDVDNCNSDSDGLAALSNDDETNNEYDSPGGTLGMDRVHKAVPVVSINGTLGHNTGTAEPPASCSAANPSTRLSLRTRIRALTPTVAGSISSAPRSRRTQTAAPKQQVAQHKKMTRSSSADSRFKCEYCAMTFTKLNDCRRHEERHTGVRWRCDVCGKHLSREDAALRHLHLVHSRRDRAYKRVELAHTNEKQGHEGGREEEGEVEEGREE